MEEIFKPIPGYEGIYEVSNLGNVKSLGNNFSRKEKILKPSLIGPKNKKYLSVLFCVNTTKKIFKIHQLVAMAFLGHKPCGFKLVVHHKNDNPLDNRVENLEITTQRDNCHKTQGKYSSKYKGVHWDKNAKKWKASIRVNGLKKHLGLFECELKAHLTYQNELNKIKRATL